MNRTDAEDGAFDLRIATPRDDNCFDLLAAASANLSFWNNPEDDQDWNDESRQ